MFHHWKYLNSIWRTKTRMKCIRWSRPNRHQCSRARSHSPCPCATTISLLAVHSGRQALHLLRRNRRPQWVSNQWVSQRLSPINVYRRFPTLSGNSRWRQRGALPQFPQASICAYCGLEIATKTLQTPARGQAQVDFYVPTSKWNFK